MRQVFFRRPVLWGHEASSTEMRGCPPHAPATSSLRCCSRSRPGRWSAVLCEAGRGPPSMVGPRPFAEPPCGADVSDAAGQSPPLLERDPAGRGADGSAGSAATAPVREILIKREPDKRPGHSNRTGGRQLLYTSQPLSGRCAALQSPPPQSRRSFWRRPLWCSRSSRAPLRGGAVSERCERGVWNLITKPFSVISTPPSPALPPEV